MEIKSPHLATLCQVMHEVNVDEKLTLEEKVDIYRRAESAFGFLRKHLPEGRDGRWDKGGAPSEIHSILQPENLGLTVKPPERVSGMSR